MTTMYPKARQEQLPHLDSVKDCARYIRTMVGEKHHIFMTGIRSLLEDCSFSEAQKHLLEEFSGPTLAARIKKTNDSNDENGLRDELEVAFWRPIVSAAILVEDCADNMALSRYDKIYSSARLYKVIANNTHNLMSFSSTSAAQNMTKGKAPLRAQFNGETSPPMYTGMPARDVINVLRQGYLRQLRTNIEYEYGMQGNQFAKYQNMIGQHWRQDPDSIQHMPLIRDINQLRWIEAANIPQALYHEENGNSLLEGPKEP